MITYEFFGRSHGEGYGGTIHGLPEGFNVDVAAVNEQLKLRKCGYGRSARQSYDDIVEFDGAVDGKVTTSGELRFFVPNNVANIEQRQEITAVRGGHVDVVGQARYKGMSVREINEIASARNSVCYVVLGAVCKQILDTYGIFTYSYVKQIGNVTCEKPFVYGVSEHNKDFDQLNCVDPETTQKMKSAVDIARAEGNSLGGVVTVGATGVPMGLGDVFPYNKRLDAVIAASLVGIPSVKGITFGLGEKFACADGVSCADKLSVDNGKIVYATNNCGGIVGGITTGQDIVCNLVVKPVPTVKGVQTVDSITLQPTEQHYERADTCVVPQVGVIAQNILAYVLADTLLQSKIDKK